LGTKRQLAATLIALFGTSSLLSEELHLDTSVRPDHPTMGKTIRRQYVESPDLPDGVAFLTIIRSIASTEEDSDFLIQRNMGYDAASAKALREEMISVLSSYEKALDQQGEEILCVNGVPRRNGDAAFADLENIDDSADALADQYLAKFVAGMDDESAGRFAQWIRIQKQNVVHTLVDHKELALMAGKTNVDNDVAAICARLFGESD
jgi:hypothetical protein